MSELLLSLNKISLLAFIITFCFLVYEFRLLKKEKKSISKPQIPKFNSANLTSNRFQNVNIQNDNHSSKTNNSPANKFMIILLIMMLIFFAAYTVISLFKKNNLSSTNDSASSTQTEIVTLVSQGIKVYNDKNEEIKQSQIDQYPVGTNIKIGVESVKETDIDKARIRINELTWLPTHETKNYDKKYNIYYISYQIATIPAQLKIEAQLHSLKDGWLGD